MCRGQPFFPTPSTDGSEAPSQHGALSGGTRCQQPELDAPMRIRESRVWKMRVEACACRRQCHRRPRRRRSRSGDAGAEMPAAGEKTAEEMAVSAYPGDEERVQKDVGVRGWGEPTSVLFSSTPSFELQLVGRRILKIQASLTVGRRKTRRTQKIGERDRNPWSETPVRRSG